MEKQDFQNLVHRYFRGQLADNEYELLADGLHNPTLSELFAQIKHEWGQNPESSDITLKNWHQLQYKISSEELRQRNKPAQKLWTKISAVAAILIMGLIIGNVLTNYFAPETPSSQMLVFETPRGEKSHVTLPDGSKVWLNASSKLVYHPFSSKIREVELKGEAYFDVEPDKNAPFVVKTNECSIEVLGTTFNVMAYDEFNRKEISLISGKVNVKMKGLEKSLNPGQTLVLKENKVSISETDVTLSSGWIENKFVFKNIPLSELVKRLENWYDVDIDLINKNNKELNFSGTFKNEETIWQVLDAIKVYIPIDYKKTDLRTIKLTVI